MDERRRKRINRRNNLKIWSLKVRARDFNKCVVCFSSNNIDAHHLLPKERYPLLELELMNGIAVCKKHHKFGKFSFHRNPFWASEWLRCFRPEKYYWVMSHLDYDARKEMNL
jgi:hypothetical protein